eukprot:CFRG7944T1
MLRHAACMSLRTLRPLAVQHRLGFATAFKNIETPSDEEPPVWTPRPIQATKQTKQAMVNELAEEDADGIPVPDDTEYLYGVDKEIIKEMPEAMKLRLSLQNASQEEKNQSMKAKVMQSVQRNRVDTGSGEAQIAAMSARIHYLVDHMKRNPKDLHSRRGLEQLVQNRRKMMKYLRRTNLDRYVHCVNMLKLRPLPPAYTKDYK